MLTKLVGPARCTGELVLRVAVLMAGKVPPALPVSEQVRWVVRETRTRCDCCSLGIDWWQRVAFWMTAWVSERLVLRC